MARAPRRMTPDTFMRNIEPDPLADAVFTDSLGVAGELGDFLDSLRAFDVSSIKAMLYRKPASGLGGFAYLGTMPAPIHMDQVIDHLREEYGGGDYRVTVFAGGKTRKQIEFPIYGLAKPLKAIGAQGQPAAAGGELGGQGILGVLLQMQESARREAADARRDDLERQRLERERERDNRQAMLTALAPVAAAAIPLLFNREKLADLVALFNASKPEATSLKDQIETVVLLKKAFAGDDKADFDPSDLVGSLGRLAGPIAAAAGRAFGQRGTPGPDQAHEPAYDMPPLPLPQPAAAPALAERPAGGGGDRPGQAVLAVIRPHLAYFYSAGHDPALAADAIVDIMERQGVTDEAVNELVAAYGLSADWKTDLAAEGIDLRGNPQWADEFLGELVDAWTQRDRGREPFAGGAGGVADAADDAAPGAPGVALDDDQAARA